MASGQSQASYLDFFSNNPLHLVIHIIANEIQGPSAPKT